VITVSQTLSIRISDDTQSKLARLADHTRRSRSWLAAEAIAAFVDRELLVLDGIERGLADRKAGRIVPHDEAMDELDRAIAESSAQR
jgi:predicted transcriptional regulator